MKSVIWLNYRELMAEDCSEVQAQVLKDLVSVVPHVDEERIATYLETAPVVSAMGSITRDVLDPSAKVVLFPSRRTDGKYCWPSELAYYVRQYHVRIPDEFVNHMAHRGWIPPKEDEIEWSLV